MIRKWASARTNRPRPVRRIRYQMASSQPPPWGLRAIRTGSTRCHRQPSNVNGGANPKAGAMIGSRPGCPTMTNSTQYAYHSWRW